MAIRASSAREDVRKRTVTPNHLFYADAANSAHRGMGFRVKKPSPIFISRVLLIVIYRRHGAMKVRRSSRT